MQSGFFKEKQFHVLISDIRLSNGKNAFELLQTLADKIVSLHLIIYSSYNNPWLFLRFKRLGIKPDSILDKTELPEWEQTIRNVVAGKKYYSPCALKSANFVNGSQKFNELIHFPKRKWDVLIQLLKGRADKVISQKLSISKHTVNGYRKGIYKMFDVKDAPTLMNKFREFGYYDIESV